jgi:UDP-galactopyranose mutase
VPRDLLCFSHLRWDFVYQRPNHLMARAARNRRVFFVEEPIFDDRDSMTFDPVAHDGVQVITPRLPAWDADDPQPTLKRMIDRVVWQYGLDDPVVWYYTPMTLPWTDHLARSATVFDCMDHLAGFKGAPAGLLTLEAELLRRADLVLTGGAQLYAAKRTAHQNVHCFPSSVDVAHFGSARTSTVEPADQAAIPHPRFGYCGVIDERMDLDLVAAAAAARPDWHFVMLGPVVKIDPAGLPQAPNIHYLGMKSYEELPGYLAGWDVAIMPFAHNEATRYISPTKTPEYLAAGLPVVSTGIHDVVEPYGRRGLVEIGDGAPEFIAACDRALATDLSSHTARADVHLSQMSWDRTWASIDSLLTATIEARTIEAPALPRPDLLPAAPRLGRTVGARRAGIRTPAAGVAASAARGGAAARPPVDRSVAALD